MVIVAFLAATLQISAPAILNLPWFNGSDFPQNLLGRASGTWWVGYAVTVAPDGHVVRCEIEATSGIASLDKHTCAIIQQRARFAPARLSDGSTSYGVHRNVVTWNIDARQMSLADTADLQLSVDHLPEGLKSPSTVRVMFAVDTFGKVSSCVASPTLFPGGPPNSLTLVQLACDQLLRTYTPKPARNATGNAVPSVQDARVSFTPN